MQSCQTQGGGQYCIDNVMQEMQQFNQSGNMNSNCSAWDTDCIANQQMLNQNGNINNNCSAWDTDCIANQRRMAAQASTPMRPMGNNSWNLFGIMMQLMIFILVPFLIVGFSIGWSFTKWPSKRKDQSK